MWIFDRNPMPRGPYWCLLADGTIQRLELHPVGFWRQTGGKHYSGTDGEDVIAWWKEPKPEKPKIITVEIITDEHHETLQVNHYTFQRLRKKGEKFVTNYKEYLVIDSQITFGKLGCVLIECVVRLIADETPKEK